MKKKDTISQEDWKYMEQKPYGDADFDPEHNKKVIKETNDWNDMMDRKRERDHKQALKERTEASAQYLKNIADGKGVSSIDQYFGKRYLSYLRGMEIVNKLKSNPELVKKMKEKWEKKGTLKPL